MLLQYWQISGFQHVPIIPKWRDSVHQHQRPWRLAPATPSIAKVAVQDTRGANFPVSPPGSCCFRRCLKLPLFTLEILVFTCFHTLTSIGIFEMFSVWDVWCVDFEFTGSSPKCFYTYTMLQHRSVFSCVQLVSRENSHANYTDFRYIEPKQILYVCFMRDQLMPETMGNPIETVGVVKSISARIILLHQTTNGTNIETHSSKTWNLLEPSKRKRCISSDFILLHKQRME